MSRDLCRATVAALVVAGATTARAQTTAEWRDRYTHVSRAVAELYRAGLAVQQQHQVAYPVDTIRSGDLIVLVTPAMTRYMQAVADSAWKILTQYYGDRAAVLSDTRLLALYPELGDDSPIPVSRLNATPVTLSTEGGVGATADHLVAWVEPLVTKTADRALQEWGLNAPSLTAARPALVYEELATSPWHHARACYLGALASCRLALGISGDSVTDWFDATDRRHYLERMSNESWPGSEAVYGDCTRRRDDSACIRLMRMDRGWHFVTPPFSVHARLLLLSQAIASGGPGAFERLVAAVGQPLDARLAAAARMPIDSLVSHWRSYVVAAHPKTVAADTGAAWAAVFWGVFLTVAALRSTRWR
jgi:hypothetical protein